MCRLFETIRIIDGRPGNLDLHEQRLNRARRMLFGLNDDLRLSDYIRVPEERRSGIFRCRVVYGQTVVSTEFTPYVPAAVRTLRLVHADTLTYDHKYLDRSSLTGLIERNLADDILIVREGCITDSSYANIVFSDGQQWVTPDTPLLCGTMRKRLLLDGVIKAERITVDSLGKFTHFRLINAMLGFESPVLPIENIIR
ncbi:MAG: aminotransferase class IV [Bacteroidales bacterium]|nr:aminotransferase class IV [Bacteroidales bacterium]